MFDIWNYFLSYLGTLWIRFINEFYHQMWVYRTFTFQNYYFPSVAH